MNRLRSVWHFLQYLYYLRFALLLWLALPALALLDPPGHPSALIHAIFTPEYFGQFLGCAFFAVSCSTTALLLARIICINGRDRFPRPGMDVPKFFTEWLGYGTPDPHRPGNYLYSDRRALLVLLLAQLPVAYVLYRLFGNSYAGDATFHTNIFRFVAGACVGLMLAVAFWFFVSVIYYWTFPYRVFRRPARTLLFPRSLFRLDPVSPNTDTIERCARLGGVLGRALNRLFLWIPMLSWPGYSTAGPLPATAGRFARARRLATLGQLWESHRLVILGLFGSLSVYCFLFPITAPVAMPWITRCTLLSGVAFFATLCQAFLAVRLSPATCPQTLQWRKGLIIFTLIAMALLLLWLVASFLHHSTSAPEWHDLWFRPPLIYFPVMASVAILLIFVFLALSVAAFFLDRYSFPVLTSLIVVIAVLHVIFPKNQDHYFAAVRPEPSQMQPLLTPVEIIEQRCKGRTECPLVLLTATGGGMHAALWTASVFSQLERALANPAVRHRDNFDGLHQNLIFASTVSGGSMGFATILREYLPQPRTPYDHPVPFDLTPPQPVKVDTNTSTDPLFEQRAERAAKCSSLEAVAWGLTYSDFLHFVLPFLPPTREFDRSISLEVASERNYNDAKCGTVPTAAPGHAVYFFDPNDPDYFSLAASDLRPSQTIPAFAFNTTEVETGGRFLLANYANPPGSNIGGLPGASSFLQVYPGTNIGLVTAARLSATYPFVSSAARIDPAVYCDTAGHFVDGGYYDNDGVATLVEFLASAFLTDDLKKLLRDTHVHLLVVEVRDGFDLDSQTSPESACTCAEGCRAQWSALDQITAPLVTFWNSGHMSISRRNRRELGILQIALQSKGVDLRPLVIPFNGNPPLSWHLSSGDIAAIQAMLADPNYRKQHIQPVLDWATKPDHYSNTARPKSRP